MTAITVKKVRDKLMEGKKPEMKKTVEQKKDTNEGKNKRNTILEELITTKQKPIK